MKKQILILSTIIIGLLVSCEKEELISEIKLDKTELSLVAEKSDGVVKILSGNGGYKAISSDEKVATVSVVVAKDKSATVSVKPLKSGKVTVTVTDSKNKKASFEVTVSAPDISVEKIEVNTTVKRKVVVAITKGSGKYEVSSDKKDIATAEIKEGKVEITAVALGDAQITVKDVETKKEVVIKVKVAPAPEIIFDKSEKDSQKGLLEFVTGQTGEITITSGTPPYTLKSSFNIESFFPKTFKKIKDATVEEEEYDYYGDKKKRKILKLKSDKIVVEGFTTSEVVFDSYKVVDAVGKERELSINVFPELTVNKTTLEVIKEQTVKKLLIKGMINGTKITVDNDGVVAKKDEENQSSSERKIIVTGKKVGTSVITFTDGVVTKEVTVTIKEPKPLKLTKGSEEITDGKTYAESDVTGYDNDIIVEGGNEEYTVELSIDGTETELLKADISKISYGENEGKHKLKLERNVTIREGGVVTIKVIRKDDTSDTKTFKVTCDTLLDATFKIGSKVLTKDTNPDDANAPYYTISGGMFAGYNLFEVKVNDVIDITVLNGSGEYEVTGSDSKIEVIKNDKNETFKVKAIKDGTYYGELVIKDKNSGKMLKITRIYINE